MGLTVFLGTIVLVVLIVLGGFFYVIVSDTSSVNATEARWKKQNTMYQRTLRRNGDAQDR